MAASRHNTSNDTIAAIATPLGAGGIGIVRVSGPQAAAILSRLFTCGQESAARDQLSSPCGQESADRDQLSSPCPLPPRRLVLGRLQDAQGRELDRALAVLMPGPQSYTGEDVAEFQLHGGLRLLREALAAVIAAGARLATPGEFTLRAFVNGKLDLAQAEAVADLIRAKTRPAAQLAADQLAGRLSQAVAALEDDLLALMAAITVGVDFPDDADAPEPEQLLTQLEALISRGQSLLDTADQGRVWREGLRAALAGAVNVGKSSLLNALLEAERAIVASEPGTTRDVIEESLDLNGVLLQLSDTAGLRNPDQAGQVERIGMERSANALAQAQLALIVADASQGIDPEARRLWQQTEGRPRLLILNKADLVEAAEVARLRGQFPPDQQELVIPVSALSGQGLADLRAAITNLVGSGQADAEAGSAIISNVRHQQALLQAVDSLRRARAAIAEGVPADLAAIDLENACSSLGEISGRTTSEAVLDQIFSQFCLGK